MNDADLWLLRALWLILPFTVGPAFAAALDESERPFRVGTTVGLWVLWAAMLAVLMVPRAETLTVQRIVVPAMAMLFVWATIDAGTELDRVPATGGAISAAATLAMSMRSSVADKFVDGSSYGDETRFLLRTPGALVVGPLIVVWAIVVVGALAGPLLLLSQRWIVGAIVLVLGWPLAWFAMRAVHRLSQRWLVFVPAGVVVHDKTALREPQLFGKRDIALLGAAPIDAQEEDLSLNALGLALRVRLNGPSKIIRNSRQLSVDLTDIDGFIVTPIRPGAVIAEAHERGFAIG